ncbi:MAG TPA: hypothetical protein VHC91_20460 [Trinickia sp.]|uniref:hypothetical protein n=1 Tax=Trinickia sp. TaxID=2571163 RepID=UPI002B71DB0A|nr:hypothetical protein [Trinickia sp.]HVW52733.1 hypothetical protein [Trinickia sp.]
MTLEPGSIVCKLTAASELVCSQVASHDRSVLSVLHDWQDLLGAFLGAVIGIVGALIVASATKRRSRNIAALLLLPDLKSYMSLGEAIETDLHTPENSPVPRLKVVAILHRRVALEQLHGSEANQVFDIDHRLWAHLAQCQRSDKKLTRELEACSRAQEEAQHADAELVRDNLAATPSRPIAISRALRDGSLTRLLARTASVEDTFDLCIEHATLAHYFLGQFIFRPWYVPAFAVRWRMKFRPNDCDRRSRFLLKEQQVLRNGGDAKNDMGSEAQKDDQHYSTLQEPSTSSSGLSS